MCLLKKTTTDAKSEVLTIVIRKISKLEKLHLKVNFSSTFATFVELHKTLKNSNNKEI